MDVPSTAQSNWSSGDTGAGAVASTGELRGLGQGHVATPGSAAGLVSQLPSICTVFAPDGQVLYQNPASEAYLGQCVQREPLNPPSAVEAAPCGGSVYGRGDGGGGGRAIVDLGANPATPPAVLGMPRLGVLGAVFCLDPAKLASMLEAALDPQGSWQGIARVPSAAALRRLLRRETCPHPPPSAASRAPVVAGPSRRQPRPSEAAGAGGPRLPPPPPPEGGQGHACTQPLYRMKAECGSPLRPVPRFASATALSRPHDVAELVLEATPSGRLERVNSLPARGSRPSRQQLGTGVVDPFATSTWGLFTDAHRSTPVPHAALAFASVAGGGGGGPSSASVPRRAVASTAGVMFDRPSAGTGACARPGAGPARASGPHSGDEQAATGAGEGRHGELGAPGGLRQGHPAGDAGQVQGRTPMGSARVQSMLERMQEKRNGAEACSGAGARAGELRSAGAQAHAQTRARLPGVSSRPPMLVYEAPEEEVLIYEEEAEEEAEEEGEGEEEEEEQAEKAEEAEEAEEEEDCQGEVWHQFSVVSAPDPHTGKPVLIVTQIDVTQKVLAERHLVAVAAAERSLLVQLLPAHVLQHMVATHPLLQTGFGGPSGSPSGSDAQADAVWPPPADWRPALADPSRTATLHPQASVLFADVYGLDELCTRVAPQRVLQFLNDLFAAFDAAIEPFGVHKVETIGGLFMVAAGLLQEGRAGGVAVRERWDPLHADKAFMFAKAMLSAAARATMPTTGEPVQLRIGIHAGPVVSGIVGNRVPRFVLFGDTVNMASRLQTSAAPGTLHVSEEVAKLLRHEAWVPTGGVDIKGKGRLETFVWQLDTQLPARDWHDGCSTDRGGGAAGPPAADPPHSRTSSTGLRVRAQLMAAARDQANASRHPDSLSPATPSRRPIAGSRGSGGSAPGPRPPVGAGGAFAAAATSTAATAIAAANASDDDASAIAPFDGVAAAAAAAGAAMTAAAPFRTALRASTGGPCGGSGGAAGLLDSQMSVTSSDAALVQAVALEMGTGGAQGDASPRGALGQRQLSRLCRATEGGGFL
ncbi:hypothetical protein HYH03_004068 [Edaphochlamys debaryana]|uniref:Guanylate cyclase domain-containing protein n=1 Tax=Edaphochlamys debaryana TaxID=47281 RepID=A0A835YA87_9CHLO|nr:hypothetical protein HYH03_004068 [Edaphochlamys debaryana]|eukprot:KAG2497797.1 hypothetical protein HYH03_004068 [Edaphochlamys debaryana]